MKRVVSVVVLITCLGLGGCASDLMQPADSAVRHPPLSQSESAIVFFRATNIGGVVQAPVLETTGGQLKFVGIVSAGMKVLHKTTPGKRFYMVSGENAELLEAELAGGKTYYVYVSPRLGFWRSRFVFVPVTDKELATDSFRNDLAWCKWHENKPEGNEWFVANLPSLQAKYTDALEQYQKAGPEERKVIKPVYGTAVPVDSMGAP